jgi:hypothetical protein
MSGAATCSEHVLKLILDLLAGFAWQGSFEAMNKIHQVLRVARFSRLCLT